MKKLKKVLIFGGTHGNEWTGIYAVKKYAEVLKKEFPELDLHFIMANPEAFTQNTRFKDEDLNRAFQFLQEDRPNSYEHKRAKEIKELIDLELCFVLDLHTTTSNMGNTVIISHAQSVNFHVGAELSKNLPDCRVILSPDPHKKYLASQSAFGLMVEIGPVANGVIKAESLHGTLKIIKEVLKTLSHLPERLSGELEVYEEIKDIYYPQNDNDEINAYIHSEFQDKDFDPLENEYIPFKSFTGENLPMKTSETLYPIFINEAAYYPKKMAFTLCKRRTINY